MRLTRNIGHLLLAWLLTAAGVVPALAGPPARFVSRGPGGGGAFFGPSINPYNNDDLWVGSDMSDLFHSTDFGGTWDTVDFRLLLGGNQPGRMVFSSNPLVRYALNGDVPSRSYDGGVTWTDIPPDSGSVYCLYADPSFTNRLIVSDYTTLKISTNCGASYKNCYTNNDLLIAGVFWDGQTIYVGTRAGMVVSTNGGGSFKFVGTPGIPATEEMVSFAGAKEAGALRFFCVTFGAGDVWPGIEGSEYPSYMNLYRLDGGTGSWALATNGLADNHLFIVDMCRSNTSIAYAAGSDDLGQPVVLKTVNGGTSWSQVMRCTGNANVATGWTGDDSGSWNWKKWSFGECAMGFSVSPTDPNRAVITDFGFIHITTNGGTTWRQAYDWQGTQNAVGTATPKNNFYTGSGAEDTSCWSLSWYSSNTLFCCFTDMRGMLSTNGGGSWMSPMSLSSYNSTYQTLKHPTNSLVYAAVSSVHDMYAWDRYCQDSGIDGGTGEIYYSADQGATWARFKNLGKPVVGLALDPNNPTRLYAAMVNSTNGGIYRTINLNAGTSSTWSKLAVPPRTQGHPYNIYVLNDGTLVATYSARIAANDFQPSSGVFVSTTDGASWVDRTDASMKYYTKDLTIDPNDPTQSTWYAGVWGEWGSSANKGGLYYTANRGVSWTRIASLKAVGSCAINPANPDEMYVTTEDQGLWYSANRRAATPTFSPIDGYPFRFPTRVFFNPYNANEVWVTSYGNGMRLGRINEPQPRLANFTKTNASASSATVIAAPGQKIVVSASSDLQNWTPIATNVMFTSQVPVGDVSAAPSRFFRAEVR